MLLHLPLPQILRVQRVSRSWNTIIKNSPNLQKALFLRPSEHIALKLPYDSNVPLGCPSRENCDRKILGTSRDHSASEKQSPFKRRFIVANPFINTEATTYYSTHCLEFDFLPERLHRQGSLRKMLITQPPLQEVAVDDGHACHLHILRAKKGNVGITWGDVCDHHELFPIPEMNRPRFVQMRINADAAKFINTDGQDDHCATSLSAATTAAHVLQTISKGPYRAAKVEMTGGNRREEPQAAGGGGNGDSSNEAKDPENGSAGDDD